MSQNENIKINAMNHSEHHSEKLNRESYVFEALKNHYKEVLSI